MAAALSSVGYFLYLDKSYTPVAVVTCVILFNAAFGFSWGPLPWYVLSPNGEKSRTDRDDAQALPSRDPTPHVQGQRRIDLDGDQLAFQLDRACARCGLQECR